MLRHKKIQHWLRVIMTGTEKKGLIFVCTVEYV